MAFSGKATYTSGTTLPGLVEDVSDLISIVSPFETPLLDALGDPLREATSTYHEWMEDSLLPNTDKIGINAFADPETDTYIKVDNSSRFRVWDQVMMEGASEVMLVTAIPDTRIVVQRCYGGTPAAELEYGKVLTIIGNAALEGAESPKARFSVRTRKGNYTQIFTSSVEVSGSDLAASHLGLSDEMDYQKQERLREMIRDLENTIVNGAMASVNPEGTSATPRTLKGIIQHIASNKFTAGLGDIQSQELSETTINYCLENIWKRSSGNVDLIVVNGSQKRKINAMLNSSRRYASSEDSYRNMVNVMETDFGVCKVIMTRWMPQDSVLFLDSSRIDVMPLAGRSFHYKPMASRGDFESGEIIGEYTLEMKNEEAHGLINNLLV